MHLIEVIFEIKAFLGDGTQNYIVFQPMYKYFKKIDFNGNMVINI